jgi:hypothetical protein
MLQNQGLKSQCTVCDKVMSLLITSNICISKVHGNNQSKNIPLINCQITHLCKIYMNRSWLFLPHVQDQCVVHVQVDIYTFLEMEINSPRFMLQHIKS